MGIFDRFPTTKLNDINLDWVLKKLRALRGGAADQVLAKASDADFDFKWVTGGGGGTSDYDNLINQPQINSVTLTGNLSASDLSLLDAGALNDYRTAAAQDLLDAAKQAKITASGILKGDGDGGVAAAAAGTDYLAPAALNDYRTAAAQDLLDAAKQAKITASGMLKGDGNGGVAAATAGTDYLEPSALNSYRTAAAQDLLDAAQDADIASRTKADEIAIVITGKQSAKAIDPLSYVIVRNSTISGRPDGTYINTSGTTLPANTDISAADLTAINDGVINELVKAINFQGTWNSSYITTGEIDCHVTGRFLFINAYFQPTTDIQAYTLIGTLPKKVKTVFWNACGSSINAPSSVYVCRGMASGTNIIAETSVKRAGDYYSFSCVAILDS